MDKNRYTLLYYVIIMSLSLCAWNMRSVNYAGPYIEELCKTHDVIVGAEHRLYSYELNKLNSVFPGFSVRAKASKDLSNEDGVVRPGHCGICIAWKQHLNQKVKQVNIDSDRICAIQIIDIGENKSSLFIIGVYLPQRQCRISDFDTELALLESVIEQCKTQGEVTVVGDFNCHFGWEYGGRFWGETTQNGLQLMDMITRQGMTVADAERWQRNPCALVLTILSMLMVLDPHTLIIVLYPNLSCTM